jgi:alkylated DNA repair dioxygenase AlkB
MSQTSSPLFTPPASPKLSEETDTASLEAPAIPGLYYFTNFFVGEETEHIVEEIIKQGYFDVDQGRDQAVLFGSRGSEQDAGLPQWTRDFLSLVASRLKMQNALPRDTYELLFPSTTEEVGSKTYIRQLILNCYQPGQGIAAHIDLPHKFLDGIMIFSFGSSITMTFENVQDEPVKESVYLTPCSLCVLSGESRWQWKHGIPQREGDYVWNASKDGKRYIKRGQRLSITVRWYRLEDGDHTSNSMNGLEHKIHEGGKDMLDTGKMEGKCSDTRLSASCNT